MDEQQYMCDDGKCGECPRCQSKKRMMAIGYSEDVADAVVFSEKFEIMSMVKTRLKVMHGLVSDIEQAIAENPNGKMQPWMIDKVTMSADYLSAVADNAKYGDGLEADYKEGDSFDKGAYGKGLSEKDQDKARATAKKAMKAEKEGKGVKEVYKPWPTDKAYNKKKKEKGEKHQKSKHTKKYEQMFGKDTEDNAESMDFSAAKSLAKKAKKSGFSLATLRKVYQRGMGAWKSGHRPGMSPQAWAMARVNSFITGGGARKADKDLVGGKKKKK